jgi:hypothetical protein
VFMALLNYWDRSHVTQCTSHIFNNAQCVNVANLKRQGAPQDTLRVCLRALGHARLKFPHTGSIPDWRAT